MQLVTHPLVLSSLLGLANSIGDSTPSYPLLRRLTQAELCQPAVSAGSVIPPCTSIETIETQCLPNGTAPIYLIAHAECMCGGSFFQDWLGCRSCLVAHGFLSQRDEKRFVSALDVVSTAMCAPGATPSAEFDVLFKSAAAAQPKPSDGSTETGSDSLSGSTAVSLYYTAPSSQGPGAITGSAATATATGGTTAKTTGSGTTTTTTASRTTLSGTNTQTTTSSGPQSTDSNTNAGSHLGAPGLLACGVAAVLAGL